MASAGLKSPEEPVGLDFDKWKQWHKRMELFLVANFPANLAEARKIAVYLHCIGPDGRAVAEQFTYANDENEGDYATLIKKFEEHFSGSSNPVFERFRFFGLTQKQKSFEDFFIEAKRQMEFCRFDEGDVKKLLLRDIIVFTTPDETLKKKLLSTKDLTLEEAIRLSRVHVETEKQLTDMRNPPEQDQDITLAPFSKDGKQTGRGYKRDTFNRGDQRRDFNQTRLIQPNLTFKCHKCQGFGHLAKQCPSRRARPVAILENTNERDGEEPSSDEQVWPENYSPLP